MRRTGDGLTRGAWQLRASVVVGLFLMSACGMPADRQHALAWTTAMPRREGQLELYYVTSSSVRVRAATVVHRGGAMEVTLFETHPREILSDAAAACVSIAVPVAARGGTVLDGARNKGPKSREDAFPRKMALKLARHLAGEVTAGQRRCQTVPTTLRTDESVRGARNSRGRGAGVARRAHWAGLFPAAPTGGVRQLFEV